MSSRIVLGNVTIDRDRFEVWIGEKRIDLTFVEFELLCALAKNVGKVVPRSRLVLAVWNERSTGEDRKLTVHMSRLRKKLRGSDLWKIETVTKRGYVLAAADSREKHSSMGPGGARLQKTAGEI
jgi:DNA-binding response OmpR family regulator